MATLSRMTLLCLLLAVLAAGAMAKTPLYVVLRMDDIQYGWEADVQASVINWAMAKKVRFNFGVITGTSYYGRVGPSVLRRARAHVLKNPPLPPPLPTPILCTPAADAHSAQPLPSRSLTKGILPRNSGLAASPSTHHHRARPERADVADHLRRVPHRQGLQRPRRECDNKGIHRRRHRGPEDRPGERRDRDL